MDRRSMSHLLDSSIDRREFVKVLGVGTAGVALGCTPGNAAGRVPARKLDSIGIQLYTVRQDMERDFDGTLARIAAIGYKEVEFAGYFGHSPTYVRSLLDRLGLSAPSSHIGSLPALTTDLEKTIADGKVMGHKYLILPWVPPEARRTLDDYRKIADLLNTAGATTKKAGVRIGYHNHDFEFTPLEGRLPYDVILERTNPELVAMEMDLYWITKGGQKPLEYFERHPGRFELVHVKDMDGSPQQKMVDVGSGIINWRQIFAERDKAGIKYFFVEHDNPSPSALGSAKNSYDYLSRLTF